MFEIPLQYSIHTLDGKELVPAGTVLTEDVIREIIASNVSQASKSMSLMQFGSVRDNIFQFLSNPPYKVIFDNHEDTEDVLNLIEQVILPVPVLESLDYFREYDYHTYRHMLMIFAISTLLAKILYLTIRG
jgi:hypothetical protein